MNAPPPPYVQLQSQTTIKPPPYRRNVPRYHSEQRSRRSFCCRCICCCYCFLFLLILLFASFIFYFFYVYHPQYPSYKVQDLQVKAFDVQHDFSLKTQILVSVRADNPNSGIGFTYGEDSSVRVIYNNVVISSGKLPAFHQGKKNVTVMQVYLKGVSEFGSGLQEAMMENKHKGRIPLMVKVKVPVRVVVSGMQMRQILVFVNCSLVVDNLAPNKKINILSSKYDATFSL
ncbi:hypothetical protein LguiA_035182 [Lonicera macranthoides]